jgi:eukaryotic-like serine/threonine-protein kinase
MSTGRRISRYLILRQLGHGNLTRVFLANLGSSDHRELCVLKLVRPELAADDDFRALFLDQAATTLSLSHPNLVRTVDVIADPEACGLTMEFLEGQTLARIIERMGRTRFPVDMHLHVLSKVLAALDYAHSLPRTGESTPFLHGDLCPGNVFLTHDGEVKLLGTGFAEATRALETKLGRPLADVRYAAPEVLLGHSAGPSADVFALGVMLWEAVARQARLAGDDRAAIIQRRTSGEEPELEKAWPDAPVPVIDMCRRALAADPKARYGSAAELRSDLDAYLGRVSQSSEAVLQRLAESTQQLFAAEREQMQLFIGSTLKRARDHSIPPPRASLDAQDELTPHEEEWNAPTSARIPALDMAATGNLALVANDAKSGREETAPDRVQGDSVVGSSDPIAAVTVGETPPDPGAAPSLRQPAPKVMPLDFGPPRDSSTGGHRAFSTSLEASPLRRSGKLRLSPDVLGAAALIIGSIVAVYSLHRHSTRDKRMDSEQLAVQGRVATPSAGVEEPGGSGSPAAKAAPLVPVARESSDRGTPRRATEASSDDAPPGRAPAAESESARPTVVAPAREEPSAIVRVAADAEPDVERQPSVSAFFDGAGKVPKVRSASSPLRAADLPPFNPVLDSLQDAILMHARRRAAGREPESEKREKKPDPVASAANGGSPTTHPSEQSELATPAGSD